VIPKQNQIDLLAHFIRKKLQRITAGHAIEMAGKEMTDQERRFRAAERPPGAKRP